MSTFTAFQTNSDLETNGIYLDFGSAGRFKIARAGGANKKFEKAWLLAVKPYRRAMQIDGADDDVLRQVMYGVYAETVLLGWEGVTDEADVSLPFTTENAKKLFTKLPDLFNEIRTAAQNHELFLAKHREGDIKN